MTTKQINVVSSSITVIHEFTLEVRGIESSKGYNLDEYDSYLVTLTFKNGYLSQVDFESDFDKQLSESSLWKLRTMIGREIETILQKFENKEISLAADYSPDTKN